MNSFRLIERHWYIIGTKLKERRKTDRNKKERQKERIQKKE